MIAVRNLDQAVDLYTSILGRQPSQVAKEPHGGIRNAFFPLGDAMLELAEPTDPGNPMTRFLERRGEGVWGISLEVADCDAEVKSLRGRGIQVTEEQMEIDFASKLAWIHPRSANGVFVQLLQR